MGTLKPQSNGPLGRAEIRWLVHWPLMGRLLHFVQRGWAWSGCGLAQSLPRCTKCNSPPMYQLHIIRYDTIIDSKF